VYETHVSTVNAALANATAVVFFLSVPLLLTVRGWRPARLPWSLVVIAAAVFSWILVNLALYFQAKYERDSLTFADPPTRGNLVWGWVPGIVYLALLLVPYGVIMWEIRRGRLRKPPT
jgi:hypothetical protein